MIIYKTTNIINNKFYIGYDTHDDPNYLGSGKILKRAIKKYGRKNFIKEVIERCSDENDLNKREIYWIDKLNATNKKLGYNIATGGNGGWLGEEVNKNRIKSLTGKPKTKKHRKNLSKSHTGKKLKVGQHNKIVESRRNNGKEWATENWKNFMSEFMKGNDYGKNNKGQFQPKGENSTVAVKYKIKSPSGEVINIITRKHLESYANEINKNRKRGNKFRIRELIDTGESKNFVLLDKKRINQKRGDYK